MGKIRPLSKEMIGKIAAGEVVERPAAAVKELVENSLDAGATTVTVEIREGGLDYIRVTDNGCGIDESDIRMAFERHATSKIRKDEELDAIATLGFRGEALASIAAVAHVTLITRTADRDTGLKVLNEGGSIVSVEEHACPVGTNIIVTDLFYNTYPNPPYVEILKKGQRAYNCILFQTHYDYYICVPYRTEISHKYAFHFKKTKRSKLHKSGLDYTKIIIISIYT